MYDLKGIIGIIFIFGSPVVIVLIVCGLRLLRYGQRQRTVRLAIEKGLDVSPLLADEAAKPADPRQYLLRGLLWGLPGLLIGVGVTGAAIQHAHSPYSAMFGWIPAAVGAAYLIFYRWGLDRTKKCEQDTLPPAP